MDWRERLRTGADRTRSGSGTLDPEDVVEAMEIANRIARLDLEGIIESRKTPLDRVLEKADAGLLDAVNRSRRPKPKPKREHWRTRKKKRKEVYHRVTKPKRQMRKLEQLKGGARGWYQYLRTGWIKSGTKFTLSEEEFVEHIWPRMEGRLPMFLRYNPNEPVSLYNVYVVDVDNEKQVLYDGMELQMKQSGYML